MLIVITVLCVSLIGVVSYYKYKKNIHLFELQEIQKQLNHCYVTEKECRQLLKNHFAFVLTVNMRFLIEQRVLKALDLICKYQPLAFSYHSFRSDIIKSVKKYNRTDPFFDYYNQPLTIKAADRIKLQKYITALRQVLRSETSRRSLPQELLVKEDEQLILIAAFFEVNYLLEKTHRAIELEQGGTVHYCCDQALKIIDKHVDAHQYWREVQGQVTTLTNSHKDLIRKATAIPVRDEEDWQMEYLFGTKKRYIS